MSTFTLLIIDDSYSGRSEIEAHLADLDVTIQTETNVMHGMKRVLEEPPDLLIVDVAYAGIDAWSLIDRVRRNTASAELPIVMVTGFSDVDHRIRSFEMGADDVITKPYNKAELLALVRNVAKLNRFRKLAEQRAEIQRSLVEVEAAYDKTIQGWVTALDLRDQETHGHSVRVAQLTVQLARQYGFEGIALTQVWRGALLHDIGKLAMPDSILKKAGKLSPEERLIMEKHPMHAHEMLYAIEYLRPAMDIPVYHHEKFDGTGYPFTLKGEEIPLAARLFAVVDVWDALSFNRPYRKAMPQDKVHQILLEGKGNHFQPDVVDSYLALLAQIERNVPAMAAQWMKNVA